MPITKEIIEKVAEDTGISVDELATSGLLALLREKKRKIMIDRLDVLSKYDASSSGELEKRIKDGKIAEHPAWEELILIENLEAGINRIDEDLKAIQESL